MVRSEQGLAEDARDLSSIPVLAKCTGILAPHPAVPASLGMTLATPLPAAGFRVWKAPALAPCLAAHTFCSQNHHILLCALHQGRDLAQGAPIRMCLG